MATDDEALDHVTEWPGGFSWIADPDERGQRASHALSTDAGVWLVDPVDADGLDARVEALGEPAGVLLIQDRHSRDAAAIADRHDVPIYAPEWMQLLREKLEAPVEAIGTTLPGSNYAIHRLIETEEWEEAIIVDEQAGTLIVPETVGTLPAFRDHDNALGVHPGVDEPPEILSQWTPERILVGHGASILEDATPALREALKAH